jgi:Rps23 Pro-64 3,4-dihydroxylase Tpa1-like proline 4-hydroxylase
LLLLLLLAITISAQIRQFLVPDAAAVRADLYKLNLMGPGGFFKPHKDTPRGGDTCFGTFVVCLPLPFSGGELRLKHGQ